MDRRHLITTAALGSAAALIPAAAAHAEPLSGPHPGADAATLQRAMRRYLADELRDLRTARVTVPRIFDIGFNWHPPVASVATFDFLLAFGFGNRPPANGGDPSRVLPEPGPMNEDLADTVVKVRKRSRRRLPVYAQWEIARHLKAKHGMDDVVSIEPIFAEDGTITYLSTDGVVAQVVELRANRPGGVGRAGVIGFEDHIKRCVQTTRARGVSAFAPRGFAMPNTYDPQSAQAWTRDRDIYLIHDMYAQIAVLRNDLIKERYPNG
ncbi:hypothetical protein [Micropruina sp.]|uniref:hypothetical protein n=1 Tax=Micropruina sp. TaxID=2737536 RepID=UPI002606E9F0|nr:hypothetical protein [Micropruina sp.]